MLFEKYDTAFLPGEAETINDNPLSNWEITGIGNIEIRNTGGSSASEGGMGSGGGPEKGAGIKEEETGTANKEGKSDNSDSDDEPWDPLKPKEEKEKK